MGTCKYCGKPAGFLRSKHSTCAEQRGRALSKIQEPILNAIYGVFSLDTLEPKLSEISKEGFVSQDEVKMELVSCWEVAVKKFLEDGVLDTASEGKLIAAKEKFHLTQDDLDQNGAYMLMAKAGILREVMAGQVPTAVKLEGNVAFNFQKNETVVWAFNDVACLEDKTRTQYVGGSQGVSIRVAKGVYYRLGAFKGQPVSHTERVHVDTGPMIITNKHTYFGGSRKPFRIPHSKVVSFTPYSDGVGITKDSASAKQQIFITGDGWFTYNLLTNLSRL